MKRLSVTLLDAYRLYREAEWFTLDMLIERIAGPFVATREMDIGTAFHKCVEDNIYYAEVSGEVYTFSPEDLQLFCHSLPVDMIHEIKIAEEWEVSETVEVVGKADGVFGNWACDHKTSFKPFQLEKYQNSYQWRYYLQLFGCDVFQYSFAQLREGEPGEFSIVSSHFPELYRYPDMEADLDILTDEFIWFCKNQGVYHYLKDSQQLAA